MNTIVTGFIAIILAIWAGTIAIAMEIGNIEKRLKHIEDELRRLVEEIDKNDR